MINEIQALDDTIENELPSFTIENGELVSDENAPITMHKNDFTIIFDSTGTVTSDDATKATDSIFILKNELIYVFGGQSQSMPYSVFSDMTITKDDLIDMTSSIDSLLPIIIPIISIIVYLFSAISKLIGISFLALIGLAIKNIQRKDIKYGGLWRLSAYSVTMPTIFFMIMEALKTVVPSGFLIYWFVAIIMLILSMKEIPSSEGPSEKESF